MYCVDGLIVLKESLQNNDLIFFFKYFLSSDQYNKMNLFNFGREQLNNGSLNNMLEQVGIDDVGSFVNQFRNQANQEANSSDDESADIAPTRGSSLNQVC
jgi:hypothetical protein